MPLSDYQFQYQIPSQNPYDTVLFGAAGATNPGIDIIDIEGLFDSYVRDDDRESVWAGDFETFMRPAPRVIKFTLEIRGDPGDQDYYDMIQNCRYTFAPLTGESPLANGVLTFKWPGEVEKFVRCRPTRRREPRKSETEYGLVRMEVELKAADPRIYGTTVNTITSPGTATNDGNHWAYPWITITPGGASVVNLSNSSTGQVFSGQFIDGTGNLVANFDEMVRLTNNLYIARSVDNYPNWDHPRSPFRLMPGANTIAVTTGTLVNFNWFDTWI